MEISMLDPAVLAVAKSNALFLALVSVGVSGEERCEVSSKHPRPLFVVRTYRCAPWPQRRHFFRVTRTSWAGFLTKSH